MANLKLPYIRLRDGRPRFEPSAREMALGFRGQDLKHADGRWFTLDEASNGPSKNSPRFSARVSSRKPASA
jgi:hypothetical protein